MRPDVAPRPLSTGKEKPSDELRIGTRLQTVRLDPKKDYQFHSFYYPPDDAPWHPDPALMQLIDNAYIQWPHIYMGRKPARKLAARARAGRPAAAGRKAVPRPAAAAVSAVPPPVPYWPLDVPDDVSRFLNATAVHRAGTLGRGVTVVMVDTRLIHSR